MHLNPLSPPSGMEGVGWEHGELAWFAAAASARLISLLYPPSNPPLSPTPPPLVSVMLSPYFSTFFERRKEGRSHTKLSFMAILIHGEPLLDSYLISSCFPNSFRKCRWRYATFSYQTSQETWLTHKFWSSEHRS